MTCVIVGAGAQGRVILENWRSVRSSEQFVFLDDDTTLHGTKIHGAEVVGTVAALADLGGEVVLALGNGRLRLALADRLAREHEIAWGTVVHPSAIVMPSATIAPGTVVFAGAVVNTDARIGAHVIVNTGAIVEHDAVIARGASLGPGMRSGGRIEIGEGAFIATGVTLAPRVKIGAWSIIGAGAVVMKDVPPARLAYGVPAEVVSAVDDSFDWKRLL